MKETDKLIASRASAGDADPPSAKEARMLAILEAALEEFFDHGFAAARTDDIAARAGIGKGTLYLYFDSKEALFEAAVRAIAAPIFARIEALAARPDESAANLLREALMMVYRDFVATERRRILRLLIADGHRFPRLLEIYHREVISRGMAVIGRILSYGVERGEFRATAAGDFPQVIIGPAVTGALWQLLFAELEPLDVDALAQTHIDLLLYGLRAATTPGDGGE